MRCWAESRRSRCHHLLSPLLLIITPSRTLVPGRHTTTKYTSAHSTTYTYGSVADRAVACTSAHAKTSGRSL
eukprot:5447022-Pyramimonas_sp.AAC.1